MLTVELHEAQAHLGDYIRRAEAGEDVVITHHGKPSARLSALLQKPLRPFLGLLAGTVTLPDDWDVWPEEEARTLGIID